MQGIQALRNAKTTHLRSAYSQKQITPSFPGTLLTEQTEQAALELHTQGLWEAWSLLSIGCLIDIVLASVGSAPGIPASTFLPATCRAGRSLSQGRARSCWMPSGCFSQTAPRTLPGDVVGAPSRSGPGVRAPGSSPAGRVPQGQSQPTCLKLAFGGLALHGAHSLVFSEVDTTKKAISTVLLRMGLEGGGSGILMWRPWRYWGTGGSVWKKQVAQGYGAGGRLGEKVPEPVI